MLGHNREGIEDLNHLLKLDPKNTAAKKEMEVMKKLWRQVGAVNRMFPLLFHHTYIKIKKSI